MVLQPQCMQCIQLNTSKHQFSASYHNVMRRVRTSVLACSTVKLVSCTCLWLVGTTVPRYNMPACAGSAEGALPLGVIGDGLEVPGSG